MKALTIWRPWAYWIAWGWKPIETRTHDRFKCLKGERIAIHAAQKFDEKALEIAKPFLSEEKIKAAILADLFREENYPPGLVLCTVVVWDVGWDAGWCRTDAESVEALCPTEGLFGLHFRNTELLDPPIPAKGRQGIWEVDIHRNERKERIGLESGESNE